MPSRWKTARGTASATRRSSEAWTAAQSGVSVVQKFVLGAEKACRKSDQGLKEDWPWKRLLVPWRKCAEDSEARGSAAMSDLPAWNGDTDFLSCRESFLVMFSKACSGLGLPTKEPVVRTLVSNQTPQLCLPHAHTSRLALARTCFFGRQLLMLHSITLPSCGPTLPIASLSVMLIDLECF